MSERERRAYNREFKLAVVERMMAGESVAALSRELGVAASLFHKWCGHFRRGGPQALRPACRPRKGFGASDLEPEDLVRARKRISELERKVGQQQVELDFFQQALRRVRGARQPNDGRGARTSTRSSRR
jgi:transposase